VEKPKVAACFCHSIAVVADWTRNDDRVAGFGLFTPYLELAVCPTKTGGTDEEFVGFPFFGDLGIGGNQLHAGFKAGFGERIYNQFELLNGKTFFQDEGGGQETRVCSEHGDIIDRAANCQPTDIAARKEEGRNDMSIRLRLPAFFREGHPLNRPRHWRV
jgi:hypothetical protein